MNTMLDREAHVILVEAYINIKDVYHMPISEVMTSHRAFQFAQDSETVRISFYCTF